MVIGIGCDIIDHELTKRLDWALNERVQERIFSKSELQLSSGQQIERFLSGRFAAKEAVLKCLGSGMKDGIALTDIHVLQTSAGQPFIQVEGKVKEMADSMGIVNWFISISHTNNTSCAFVIAEK
jgi:holo-[acyl-carrier protein] synthase